MENENYQGWKNQETWAIALCLKNDRKHYDRMREAAKGWREAAAQENSVLEGVLTVDQSAARMMADEIERLVARRVERFRDFPDLRRVMLERISYIEIAEDFLEDN
jgi:hypothetical protein